MLEMKEENRTAAVSTNALYRGWKLEHLQGPGSQDKAVREEGAEFLPLRISCPIVFRSGFSKTSQNWILMSTLFFFFKYWQLIPKSKNIVQAKQNTFVGKIQALGQQDTPPQDSKTPKELSGIGSPSRKKGCGMSY